MTLKIPYDIQQKQTNDVFVLEVYTENMRPASLETCSGCQFMITIMSMENPTVALGMFCGRSDCVNDIPLEEEEV